LALDLAFHHLHLGDGAGGLLAGGEAEQVALVVFDVAHRLGLADLDGAALDDDLGIGRGDHLAGGAELAFDRGSHLGLGLIADDHEDVELGFLGRLGLLGAQSGG